MSVIIWVALVNPDFHSGRERLPEDAALLQRCFGDFSSDYDWFLDSSHAKSCDDALNTLQRASSIVSRGYYYSIRLAAHLFAYNLIRTVEEILDRSGHVPEILGTANHQCPATAKILGSYPLGCHSDCGGAFNPQRALLDGSGEPFGVSGLRMVEDQKNP